MFQAYYFSLLLCLTLLCRISALAQTPNFRLTPIFTNQQGQGLEILSATCNCSTTVISDYSATIKNTAGKDVVAYSVLWTFTHASGKTKSAGHTWDGSFIKQKIQPGQVTQSLPLEAGIKQSFTSPLSDPFAKVEVSIDYVEFSDGTKWGPNKAKQTVAIKERRIGAQIFRHHLLRIYKEKGIDALLQELIQNR